MVIAVEIRNLYHNREIWGNLYKKQNVHNKFDTIFKDQYLQMGSKGSFSHLFLTSSLFFFRCSAQSHCRSCTWMGTRAKNIFKGLFNLSVSVLWQYLLFLWAIYVFLFIFRRKLTKYSVCNYFDQIVVTWFEIFPNKKI